MTIPSLIRRFQGERPGMGSEMLAPTPAQELIASLSTAPAILIQNSVRIGDVSYWQGEINFVRMAEMLDGVIIRAGQRYWPDVRFKENWAKAKAAGLPRGSYFFYDSREDPKKQALLWWQQLDGDVGELVHVADLEENYGGPYWKPEHMRTFVQEFQRLSGLPDDRIAIYTGYYWWLARVGADLFFKRFVLWLAWYAIMSVVRVPAPWSETELIFWQYTSSGDGTAFGVSSLEIDLNWYCCDLVDYQVRFNLNGNGGPMADYVYSITPLFSDGSSVRPEPDTGNTKIPPGLPFGKFAYGNNRIMITQNKFEVINGQNRQVNQAGDIWLEVLEVNGQVLPAPAYIAEIHLGARYATVQQIGTPPEPPPSTFPDLTYTIILGDDISYQKAIITGVLKPK